MTTYVTYAIKPLQYVTKLQYEVSNEALSTPEGYCGLHGGVYPTSR